MHLHQRKWANVSRRPEIFEEALEKNGTRTMVNKGRIIKRFVFVSEDVLKTKADFDYWINNSLAFNKFAKHPNQNVKTRLNKPN